MFRFETGNNLSKLLLFNQEKKYRLKYTLVELILKPSKLGNNLFHQWFIDGKKLICAFSNL